MQEGEYIRHVPCDPCNSSDGVAVYKKTNEKGQEYYDGYCWVGDHYVSAKDLSDFNPEDVETSAAQQVDFNKILELECRGWKERRVGLPVSEMYGIRSEFDDSGNMYRRYYPVHENDKITGFHVRNCQVTKANESAENPRFYNIGRNKVTSQFLGQELFPAGGKHLVIVGGAEDMVSLQQALKQKNEKFTTAVVAPSCGEGSTSKQIKANYEWVTSFEKVILMLDNDDAGKKAAEDAVKVLKPGQGYIANLALKDPNEYIKQRRENELIDAFWRAERYSPSGIVGSSQTWEALVQRAKWEKVPLPEFSSVLQDMLSGGPALGEITTIAAGSSTGKTSVVNEFLYHWIFNAPYKVGVISLESDLGELTENLLSIHIKKKLAEVPDEEKQKFYETEEAIKAHTELTQNPDGSDRYIILDHQGDAVDDELKAKIEYLVKVCDCRLIILDPLTLALSGQGNDGTDLFLAWLVRFVKREMVSHVNVVHVRKSGSGAKANSTGADIHEEDLKGSSSIFQTSNTNILLMRDKENANPIIRNTTKVMVSKARRTGRTGPAGWWYYNHETARLEKGVDPHGDYSEDQEVFEQTGAFNNTKPEDAPVFDSSSSGQRIKEESF